MIYITLSDFLQIDSDLLEQIADEKALNIAESRAINTVSNYLGKEYDMTHEFRSYVLYTIDTLYSDNQRVIISDNSESTAFYAEYGIELIDNNITDDTILVKTVNTVPAQTVRKYYNNSGNSAYYNAFDRTNIVPDQNLSYVIDNTEYDAELGKILCSDGELETSELYNLFSTDYTTAGLVDIDYSALTVAEAEGIYNNMSYFDQYRLSDRDRNFSSDDRNPIIVSIVIDLMLNELLAKVSPADYNQTYRMRYEDSMTMLNDIARGRSSINIKRHVYSVAQQKGRAKWGMSSSFLKNKY